MTYHETTFCTPHNHPEFCINFGSTIDRDVEWFLSWLQAAVTGGEVFRPGETCQVGWNTLQIRPGPDGALRLFEPAMRWPLEWIESVAIALAQLRLQKDVCESLIPKREPVFPSMRQSAIICSRLRPEGSIVMDRQEPANSDSGWFIGCSETSHDHNVVTELKQVALFEAAVHLGAQNHSMAGTATRGIDHRC